jgi:hypothetical protein
VYVSTWRIKEGKLEDYRRFHSELAKVVEENEPRVAAFVAFASDDLTEITSVHVYPDAATLDRHMDVLGEKMKLLPEDLTKVMQLLEPVGIQVFGAPTGSAAQMDKGLAESGVPFTVKRRYLGGFVRHP